MKRHTKKPRQCAIEEMTKSKFQEQLFPFTISLDGNIFCTSHKFVYSEDKVKVKGLNGFIAVYSLSSSSILCQYITSNKKVSNVAFLFISSTRSFSQQKSRHFGKWKEKFHSKGFYHTYVLLCSQGGNTLQNLWKFIR